ncbi:MAG: hypothetical protein U0797_21890 [Gemmataceae bacterium]
MNALVTLLSVVAAVAPPSKAKYDPLPVKVASFGAAACDGYLYVYGGHSGKTHTYSTEDVIGKFYRVKLSGGAWEELPGGPIAQGLPLVAHRGKVIRVGGMQPRNKPGEKADNHSLKSVASFDPHTKRWSELTPLPAGRSSHDAVLVGDKLVIVGGWDQRGGGDVTWHDTALTLDLAKPGAKWESIPQPFKRRALGAGVVGGKVVVVGGLGADGAQLKVDVLDPATGKWSEGPAFPGATRNGFSPAACVVDGKLYASGFDGKVQRLCGDRWEYAGSQEVKRLVHRLVPGDDGAILVVGGTSREDDSRRVEEVRPGKLFDGDQRPR